MRCSVVPRLLSVLLALGACVPAVAGGPEGGGAPIGGVANVRELLDSLEKADKGLRSLSADVLYDKRLRLQGDQQVRRGTLHFMSAEPAAPGARPVRMFSVTFNELYIDGQLIEDPEQWIFDGQWLVEKRLARKQFVKRRIAPPDASFDPLRIGEGPLPIPIGQKADEILARYSAELAPQSETLTEEPDRVAFVAGSTQLKLTPRPGRDDDFTEIRLWYRWDDRAGRFLPRMVRTVNRSGDEAFVQLLNVRTSVAGGPAGDEPPAGAFAVAPPDDPSWEVQEIDDLPAREVAPGGEPRE